MEFADMSRCFLFQKFGWRMDMQKENLCWNASSAQLILDTLLCNFETYFAFLSSLYFSYCSEFK